jgi:hypothetical protein
VVVPDEEEQGEADREREETPHGREQLVEGFGDFQGDHQQCYREGEDGVREALHARDVLPTPAEVLLAAPPPRQPFAHHRPSPPPVVVSGTMIKEQSQREQKNTLRSLARRTADADGM